VPRINFHQQLEQLKDKLLAMAALSQQAVEYAVDAYLERDERLVTFVRENEAAINMAQRAMSTRWLRTARQRAAHGDRSAFSSSPSQDQCGSGAYRRPVHEYCAARGRDVCMRRGTLPVDIAAMGIHASDMIPAPFSRSLKPMRTGGVCSRDG